MRRDEFEEVDPKNKLYSPEEQIRVERRRDEAMRGEDPLVREREEEAQARRAMEQAAAQSLAVQLSENSGEISISAPVSGGKQGGKVGEKRSGGHSGVKEVRKRQRVSAKELAKDPVLKAIVEGEDVIFSGNAPTHSSLLERRD